MTEMATTRKNGNGSKVEADTRDALESTTSTLSSAAATAASMASDVAHSAASTAQSSALAIDGALKRLDTEPEQTLTIGAAFSLGLAAGILVGGGPRIFALTAAAPGVAMALTLLRRSELARSM